MMAVCENSPVSTQLDRLALFGYPFKVGGQRVVTQ